MMNQTEIRKCLSSVRRRVCEAFGIARYSRPSLNGLDRKLERWLGQRGGVFIEAGANDGFQQSNTYYLEKIRGWTGLLIEPVPVLAAACRKNRRQPVIEAALVQKARNGTTVTLHWAGLMTTMEGALGSEEASLHHVAQGHAAQCISRPELLQVRGRALSSLLDEIPGFSERGIDLISLDVEGAEPEALAGLDLDRHGPRFICVEARDEAAITRVLSGTYELVDVLHDAGAYRDLLFRKITQK